MVNLSDVYILIASVVLAILVIVLLVERKQMKTRPIRWAFLAFPLIIAGIVFGENRLIGYGPMGAGIPLVFIDIIVRYRNQGKTR
jgi:hypothetical protein